MVEVEEIRRRDKSKAILSTTLFFCHVAYPMPKAVNIALLAIFLSLSKSIEVTHTSFTLLSPIFLYEQRVLVYIFILTDDFG